MAKHYAIADIHGMFDIYIQVCDMLQPDDVVYFLGDAGDRGYDGFNCINYIYSDPQWIYLKGNHEDLMVKALRNLRDTWYTKDTEAYELWLWNGAYDTLEGWKADGEDYDWIERLDNLPLTAEYTNEKGVHFFMSHAGYTRGWTEEMWSDELLWSRSHFFTPWDEDLYPNDICIHGHTPNEHLVRYLDYHGITNPYKLGEPEAITYCNGHKICIDNGVFYTNATVLYDLDEMKAIPIYDRSGTVM